MGMQSCAKGALPFVAMAIAELGEVGVVTEKSSHERWAEQLRLRCLVQHTWNIHSSSLLHLPELQRKAAASHSPSPLQILYPRPDRALFCADIWIYGYQFQFTNSISFYGQFNSSFHVLVCNYLQTATVKEYPEAMTIVFFYCCFGTIQSALFTVIVERNPSAWMLHHDIDVVAIVFSALLGSVFRNYTITWCLNKKGPIFVALFKPVGMVVTAIFGVMFLGDALHLGSLIGAFIIAVGFYTVTWGQARERAMVADHACTLEISNPKTTLLDNGITQNM